MNEGLSRWGRAGLALFFIQPRRLLALVLSRAFVWALPGLGFLSAPAVIEGELLAWTRPAGRLEELLELCGAICFLVFALTVAPGPGGASPPTTGQSI